MLSHHENVRTSKFWRKSKEKKRNFFWKFTKGIYGFDFGQKKIKIISCLCTFKWHKRCVMLRFVAVAISDSKAPLLLLQREIQRKSDLRFSTSDHFEYLRKFAILCFLPVSTTLAISCSKVWTTQAMMLLATNYSRCCWQWRLPALLRIFIDSMTVAIDSSPVTITLTITNRQ